MVRSGRIKYAAILAADILRLRHLIIRLDAVNACNLRCGMCFFSDPAWRHANMKGQFSQAEIERLAAMFFDEALQVHIGCAMEPTMFREYPWLVELAKRHRVPFVGFTTNGMRLDRTAFERMIEAGLDEITLSTHGVKKETFEGLMKGADFDRFRAALAMIDKTKSDLGTAMPRLRLNYTVCPDNLDEMASFFDVYGSYRIATVQLRPIADFGNTAYAKKDLTPLLSRYHETVERFAQSCRSRNIALLANLMDPTHTHPNAAAAIYQEGLLRYLNPNIVWRDDFRWRSDDYRAHKRSVGWRTHLLRCAVFGKDGSAPPSHQAISDVL